MSAADRTGLKLAVAAVAIAGAVFIVVRRRPPASAPRATDAGIAAVDAGDGGASLASVEPPDAGIAAIAARAVGPNAPRNVFRDPPADTRSARPVETEWKGADALYLPTPPEFGCDANVVREWVRVSCAGLQSKPFFTSARSGSLVAGDATEVTFDADKDNGSIVVTLPIRRGDRRVFQIELTSGGYSGSPDQTPPALVISEGWLDGDRGPTLLASPPQT